MVATNISYVCLIFIILLEVLYVSARQREEDKGPTLGRVVEGVASVQQMSSGQYTLLSAKDLSKATQFGIKDVVNKKWLLRVDNAHGSMKSAHININAALTGTKDPHIKIPDGVPAVMGAGGEALRTVGKYAVGAGMVIDGLRLVSSITEDMSSTGTIGKKTVKTAASEVGGWVGGYGGAYAGNSIGGWLGGTIGSLFGGIGAVPGAAVGSILGGVVGGIYGSMKTSEIAEEIVN